ncbi:uncharacterized protein LOC132637469 [Lycium barbarum]|uniref:uncharacterized protein LOC132637469 n=1 Tax=Lycium barbarum TaxID=112863 RepID=UPI00293ECB19|nr:uncharacterized protein LOC132637469 [Lycium barbarum]
MDEVARLLNNGHLREFLSEGAKNHFKNREPSKNNKTEQPQHVINMIIRGVETPRGLMMKKTKFSITREKITRDYAPDGFISFSEEDAEGIIQPHNDALVISILINKTHVKRILVDPGSSANIIQRKHIKFYVIDGELRYNALLGRPWLHIMRAVPSTLHQMLKFPTSEGVKIIHGEQPAAKEMFVVEEAVQTSQKAPEDAK